jgi:aspartyl-tRNA(Asn)/glutamyl-tRNA(Gln) amidotransferase subunit A
MDDESLAFLSIPALGAALREGRTTAVSLTEFYLNRIETIGIALNAVVTVMRDSSLREARAADAELRAGIDRGALHGIPYGMKDIVAAVGAPTTWGAEAFRNRSFAEDATVVRRLREAGAILVAKLATIEMAGGLGYDNPGACLTGACQNPWDRGTWASGSSSGSAAAVAAAAVPFAIGSDTSGSILYPAAFTGTAGLRATFGRVSRAGAMTLCWTLDRLGPLCRDATDCGLVLQAIAGPDPADATTLPAGFRRQERRRDGFRLAVIDGCCDGVEREVRANFDASVTALSALGSIETVALPDFPYAEMASVITAAEAYAAFDDFIRAGRTAGLTARKGKGHRLGNALLPAHDYIRAQRIREIARRAFAGLTERYDALLAPSLGVVACPVDEDFEYGLPRAGGKPLNLAGVLAGTPTISVLNGLGRGGLPTGIQFAGAAMGENAMLDAASALERALGTGRLRPPPIDVGAAP